MNLTQNKYKQLLSPLGDFDHTKGMQRVDEESAKIMIKKFNRFFATNVPIFFNHIDDFLPFSTANKEAVGIVKNIGICEEGIYIDCRYTLTGEKLREHFVCLSARWKTKEIENGFFRPIKLMSVAMTNSPNIPTAGKLLFQEKETSYE